MEEQATESYGVEQQEQQQQPLRVVRPQQVLESLMNDGTFDGLRSKVTAHLKNNEDLKRYTQSLVENSQSLNSPGAENKSRRELFDSLRRELEGPALDRASKAAWEVILDGLGKEISEAVDTIYNKLSAQAEPVYQQIEARTPSQERQNPEHTHPGSSRNEDDQYGGDMRDVDCNRGNHEGREESRERDYPDRGRMSSRERDYPERGRMPSRDRDASRDREYSRGGDRDYMGRDDRRYSEYSERGRSRDREYSDRRDRRPYSRQRDERSRMSSQDSDYSGHPRSH